MTVSCTIDVQWNIPFFIMPEYITILNYYVTCHVNIQVKHIVKIYYFKEKIKRHATCFIRDSLVGYKIT